MQIKYYEVRHKVLKKCFILASKSYLFLSRKSSHCKHLKIKACIQWVHNKRLGVWQRPKSKPLKMEKKKVLNDVCIAKHRFETRS